MRWRWYKVAGSGGPPGPQAPALIRLALGDQPQGGHQLGRHRVLGGRGQVQQQLAARLCRSRCRGRCRSRCRCRCRCRCTWGRKREQRSSLASLHTDRFLRHPVTACSSWRRGVTDGVKCKVTGEVTGCQVIHLCLRGGVKEGNEGGGNRGSGQAGAVGVAGESQVIR